MRATCGIFRLQADAKRAAGKLRSNGLLRDRITLLVPGDLEKPAPLIPVSVEEGPCVGMALGLVVGAAVGLAGGLELGAITITQLSGAVTAAGFWGATIFLGLAGAVMGAAAGCALDNCTTDGLPRGEMSFYQHALRNGLSLVLVFTDDGSAAKLVRRLLAAEGAESIDRARKAGWIVPRRAEKQLLPSKKVARERVSAENP